MSTTNPETRLADYLRPLLTRKWLILIAVLVTTGVVYAYYRHKPNVYTASTLVYVLVPGDPVTGDLNYQQTDRQVVDQATLLDSRSTASLVARLIGFRGSPDVLLGQISVTSQPGEDFVQFTAHSGTPNGAARVANGFADAFAALVNGSEGARVNAALKFSQQQLAALGTGFRNSSVRADLVAQVERLQLEQKAPVVIAKPVEAALPPAGPSSPKPVRNAFFAFALSLVLAIAVAYGLERFDRRLKTPEEMERAFGAPMLAVLPHSGAPLEARDGEALLSSDFREPFRVLRTNIELAALDAPPRTIVITSAMPGEGKSTVARNLALAIRETGRRVAVVGLDLRHPSLAGIFGVPNGPGLTDVLRGDVELQEVEIDVPVRLPALADLLRSRGVGRWANDRRVADQPGENGAGANGSSEANQPQHSGVTLVLGGPRPANPPAVMASDRLKEVLDELAAHHDVVLIDTSPLLAVSDTVPLLRYADAVLLVGRLGLTTRDTAKRLTEFLDRVPDRNVLGVVANDLSRIDADGYGYGYGYGSYGQEDTSVESGQPPPRKRSKLSI
jgi:Mrp family chromosome partitioning ATPase